MQHQTLRYSTQDRSYNHHNMSLYIFSVARNLNDQKIVSRYSLLNIYGQSWACAWIVFFEVRMFYVYYYTLTIIWLQNYKLRSLFQIWATQQYLCKAIKFRFKYTLCFMYHLRFWLYQRQNGEVSSFLHWVRIQCTCIIETSVHFARLAWRPETNSVPPTVNTSFAVL